MIFFLITNTDWHEVPRVRHQIAFLLAKYGHRVFFLERKRDLKYKYDHETCANNVDLIPLLPPFRIHPKLRFLGVINILSLIDSFRIVFWLKRKFHIKNDCNIVYINFCQELFHLPLCAPRAKHILFIHDHFPAQVSNFYLRRVLSTQFYLSVKAYATRSVFTSSSYLSSLVEEVSPEIACDLFYPWSNQSSSKYIYSGVNQFSSERSIILYWGVKNEFLDLNFLHQVAKSFSNSSLTSLNGEPEIWLVGPWANDQCRSNAYETGLFDNSMIQDLPASRFIDIPLKRVICGLIPFKIDSSFSNHLSTVELSNKALSFVEYGIPIMLRGLPNFIVSSCFYKISDLDSFHIAFTSICGLDSESILHEFNNLLISNSGQSRYTILLDSVNSQN